MPLPLPADPSGSATAAPSTAGEILRPALLLWLVVEVGWACYFQLLALVPWRSDYELAYLVLYELAYFAVCGAVFWFVRRDAEARRVFAPMAPRVLELCLLIALAAASMLWLWDGIVLAHARDDTVSPIGLEYGMGLPWWASILTSAVAPALFEEWMCRGLLLQRFRAVMPLGYAIAVQAMLFAMMHRDSVMTLSHFAFGCVAGVLRVVAGGLWPCMLLHFGWNAYLVLLVYGLV